MTLSSTTRPKTCSRPWCSAPATPRAVVSNEFICFMALIFHWQPPPRHEALPYHGEEIYVTIADQARFEPIKTPPKPANVEKMPPMISQRVLSVDVPLMTRETP